MKIEIKEAYNNIEDIKVLFDEYTSSLGIDLTYQNYAEEYSDLPGKYSRPAGRLYIAYAGEIAAGCIGLRKFDAQRGEMKRLYVRDRFRSLGIGKMLAGQVIREARSMGYHAILLDTLPAMEKAMALYKDLGFIEIAPYYNSPIKDTYFFSLTL